MAFPVSVLNSSMKSGLLKRDVLPENQCTNLDWQADVLVNQTLS